MQHNDQQNGQNGESGGKSEGWKMLPKARPHSAGPDSGHGADSPAETHPLGTIAVLQPSCAGRRNGGCCQPECPEQGIPVRQNVTEVRDRDSADITRK